MAEVIDRACANTSYALFKRRRDEIGLGRGLQRGLLNALPVCTFSGGGLRVSPAYCTIGELFFCMWKFVTLLLPHSPVRSVFGPWCFLVPFCDS